MKTFLFRLLLFLPLAVFYLAVSYFGDAGSVFYNRNSAERIARELVGGRAAKTPANFDHRQLQVEYIRLLREKKEAILLGSSRVREIGADAFGNRSFFNHFIPSATLADEAAILDLYRKRGMMPKTIYWGLDAWILNANNGIRDWAHVDRREWKELFSPAYFQSSLIGIFSANNFFGHPTYEQPDGTRLAPAEETGDATTAKVAAQKYIDQGPARLQNFSRLDPALCRNFEALLSSLQKENVRVVFFLLPFHPRVYRYFSSSADYAMVAGSEAYFYGAAKAHGMRIFGSFDPQKAGFGDDDFYDAIHPKKAPIYDSLKK
jgi:hypothetical protein